MFWRRDRRSRLAGASSATSTSLTRDPSSPLPSGTKEKFEYGTTEGPFVVNALPHSGQYNTPPPTGHSTTAFLPEAHSPQEPSFAAIPTSSSGSHPPSPNSATNFLAISPSSGPGSPHRQEGSAFSVGSRISYNSPALGANRPNSSRTSSPSTSPVSLSQFPVPVPGLGQLSDATKIEPFIMPTPMTGAQGLTPPPSRGSDKFRNLYTSADRVQMPEPEPSSPRDIDPFSPSTVTTGATAVPLVLPPPTADQRKEARDRKASGGRAVPMRVADPPAPPYSAQATIDPVSPTLVGSGDDHSPSFTS